MVSHHVLLAECSVHSQSWRTSCALWCYAEHPVLFHSMGIITPEQAEWSSHPLPFCLVLQKLISAIGIDPACSDPACSGLRHCGSFRSLVHLAQAIAPSLAAEGLKAYDDDVHHCCAECTSVGTTDKPQQGRSSQASTERSSQASAERSSQASAERSRPSFQLLT